MQDVLSGNWDITLFFSPIYVDVLCRSKQRPMFFVGGLILGLHVSSIFRCTGMNKCFKRLYLCTPLAILVASLLRMGKQSLYASHFLACNSLSNPVNVCDCVAVRDNLLRQKRLVSSSSWLCWLFQKGRNS